MTLTSAFRIFPCVLLCVCATNQPFTAVSLKLLPVAFAQCCLPIVLLSNMSAQLTRVFAELATKVRVPDADFQVLNFLGVVNADELSFRFPNPPALEEFLALVFDHRVDDTGVVVSQPSAPADLRAWLRGPDAAAIRRLHEASRTLAQRELAKLVDEPLPGEGPRKLTAS
eukprot:5453665-Amphidinium_carterae.1